MKRKKLSKPIRGLILYFIMTAVLGIGGYVALVILLGWKPAMALFAIHVAHNIEQKHKWDLLTEQLYKHLA